MHQLINMWSNRHFFFSVKMPSWNAETAEKLSYFKVMFPIFIAKGRNIFSFSEGETVSWPPTPLPITDVSFPYSWKI
jgi:hypothetical protein